jgi:hypothetical protein
MKNKLFEKTAKLCYEHIGGKLGSLLLEQFIEKGWLAKENLRISIFILPKLGKGIYQTRY